MKSLIKKLLMGLPLFISTQAFLPLYAFQEKEIILGENLILNAGFEGGEEHWKLAKNVEITNKEGLKSNHSARLINKEKDKAISGSNQIVKVGPGETIYFSAWVKGNNLEANDVKNSGARIYIQSYDEFGKIIGGRYPKSSGLGTFDWKELKGEYTIPLNAASVTIGFGLIKGSTGEIWFDNFSLNVEGTPLFESFLITPNYRGLVLENNNSIWQTKVRITPSKETNISAKSKIVYELKDKSSKVLSKRNYQTSFSKKDTLLDFIPPKNLKIGNYQLLMKYYDDKGKLFLEQNHAIEVVKTMPLVYIDNNGFTVKDGKKIFPFGLYIGHPDDEHLSRIKNAGFNTIISYGYGHNNKYEEYLDKADKYNLNVIYSLKDLYPGRSQAVKVDNPRETSLFYINEIKSKPALLAWYTVDELLPEWLPKIDVLYNDIKKNDPDHPAFQVHYFEGPKMIEKYFYSTDILATDPYPVGREDLTLTKIRTEAAVKGMHSSKGVWSVPQIMDWAVYTKDRKPKPPTLDEMRNQTYQALIGGAKGLIYYTYYDLFQVQYPRAKELNYDNFNKIWKDVEAMSKETQHILPIILEGGDIKLNIINNEGVEIKAIEFKNELFFIVANPYYKERRVVVENINGWTPLNNIQEQVSGKIIGNKLEFSLPSIGSGVYKMIRKK